jgi:plastocyanin
MTTTHTYTQSGIYTATVLATNATNSMSATTTVFVGDAVVAVTSNAFTPRDVTIPVGGKVVWVLRQGFHSVTADDDSFEQPAGGSWPPYIHTFPAAGVNPYYCSIHGAAGGNGMAGSVTVGSGEPPQEDKKLLLPNIRNSKE